MFLIVGLGNPGNQYARTRHNAGFDIVELAADKWSIALTKRKHKALIGEGRAHGKKVILAQPQTYMNLSGESVVDLLSFYKPEQFIIVYDDVDLPAGALRIRKNGGPGTHNGMRNIVRLLGHEDFARLRVGIGKSPEGNDLKDFVLARYETEEIRKQAFSQYLRAVDALDMYIKTGDIETAMRECNGNGIS